MYWKSSLLTFVFLVTLGCEAKLTGTKNTGEEANEELDEIDNSVPGTPTLTSKHGFYTREPTLELTLTTSDTPNQMKLSQTEDCSDGEWESFGGTKVWQHGASNTTVPVSVVLRATSMQESECVSTKITHDDIAPLAPTVNPQAQSFSTKFSATLAQNNSSDTNFKEFRYTLDGTEPTCATAKATSGEVAIEPGSDRTLKFVACDAVGLSSAVQIATYTYDDDSPVVPYLVPMPTAGFVQIDTDTNIACGIRADQKVFCWGHDSSGQVGNGAATSDCGGTDCVEQPVAIDETTIPGAKTFVDLAVSNSHACALATDDVVYCWGTDSFGRLGNGPGDTSDHSSPTAIDAAGVTGNFTQLTGGKYHTCGITDADKVYCWGRANDNQIGSAVDKDVPFEVDLTALGGEKPKSIYAASRNSCVLTEVGKAYCWGSNILGLLGSGNVDTGLKTPVPQLVDMTNLANGAVFTKLSLGERTNCGLTSDHKVFCWGDDDSGNIGNGPTTTDDRVSPTAVDVSGFAGRPIVGVATARNTVCAWSDDSKIRCWGFDDHGELGNGSAATTNDCTNANMCEAKPVAVDQAGALAGLDIYRVVAGYDELYTIDASGDVYSWGRDNYGQLGNGGGAPSTCSANDCAESPVVVIMP